MDWPARAMTTPSTTVETDGSTPGEVEMVPAPRMKMVRSLFDALVRKSTDGTDVEMSAMSFRFWLTACAACTTEMPIGTDCSRSSRWRAVTVSSCTVALSAVVAPASLASAATADVVAAKAPSAVAASRARRSARRRASRGEVVGGHGSGSLILGHFLSPRPESDPCRERSRTFRERQPICLIKELYECNDAALFGPGGCRLG